ncbi:MAG TPA: hypothetical protein VMZ91_00035 [Candidatus Paceibacterota bacterium]|nr:hypothetical protein [Candidatus Paceibacterota bacterium]
MKKTILIILVSVILFSCGSKITLEENYVVIDSVKSLTDSTYEVNFKCQNNPSKAEVNFITPYRYQAGDTMWTEMQLKRYDIQMSKNLSTENQKLKDSVFFYKISLGNKIDDLKQRIISLEAQNNALQRALVKSKP